MQLECLVLMKLPIIFIFTHDSIGLGEDGPTHQAVEQLSSLRLIPGLDVWRPADTQETAAAWREALQSKERPTAFALSRQTLGEVPKTKKQISEMTRGGYVLYNDSPNPDAIIIATGSEVSISIDAAKELKSNGISVRVISMPCMEVYERQIHIRINAFPWILKTYLQSNQDCESWHKFIGKQGSLICMESFGLSGTGSDVMKHFGFTVSNIKQKIKKLIKKIGESMTIKVAINGFGRIGRNILRAKYENSNYDDIQIVAINDLGDSNINAHLLLHDTVHGKFHKPVEVEGNKIIIDKRDEILVTSEKNPEALPWSKLDVDVVFECTGIFVSKDKAGGHIKAGAKK